MKTLTILVAFFLFININAQKGNSFLSSWHKEGNDQTEVLSDGYSYYKKGKLYYFISNDNANIYIDLKIADPGIQARILRHGLTIWINMDSKLTKKMGIRFPLGSQNSEDRRKSDFSEEDISKNVNILTLLSLANMIELVGFTSEEVRRFPAENTDNFRGSVRSDNDGRLHYGMVMPIAKLPLRNSRDGNGTMPFSIGIEYGQTSAQPALPTILFWVKNVKLVTDKQF